MYCICCKKNNVSPFIDKNLDETEEDLLWRSVEKQGRRLTINNEMINNGIIHIIDAGYGSVHDMDQFIIAICDDCIKENLNDATLLIFKSADYRNADKQLEESKKKYRRRKNLDDLV
jgi:hypothetical protein